MRFQPDERRVELCIAAIEAKPAFLEAIRARSMPRFPAVFAGDYSFGLCAVFAQAVEDLTGVEASALCADQIHPDWDGSLLSSEGYVHSLVPLKDGSALDSWGVQPIRAIARRFGLATCHLDREMHLRVVAKLRENTPERFKEKYAEVVREIELAGGISVLGTSQP